MIYTIQYPLGKENIHDIQYTLYYTLAIENMYGIQYTLHTSCRGYI